MLLIALMGGLLSNPPAHDPLVPPTRVTTSFVCHGTTRTITVARGIGRDAVVALTANGKPVVGTAMSAIRTGLAPLTAIDEVTRADTTLRISERLSFGQHYAETLERWDRAFLAAGDQVRGLGFDNTFRRMWHFYLEYSRAGFASGYIDVQQLTFDRGGRG